MRRELREQGGSQPVSLHLPIPIHPHPHPPVVVQSPNHLQLMREEELDNDKAGKAVGCRCR